MLIRTNYGWRFLSGLVVFALAGLSASAVTISDEQSIGYTLSPSSWVYSSAAEGTSFDLSDDGVPTSLTVTSAKVEFSFLNLDGESELVIALFGADFAWGVTDSSLTFSVFNGAVNGSVIGNLNDNGMLDYSVLYLGGSEVILAKARLEAEAGSNARLSVPDAGATLLLLGLGVTSLGLVARRRSE